MHTSALHAPPCCLRLRSFAHNKEKKHPSSMSQPHPNGDMSPTSYSLHPPTGHPDMCMVPLYTLGGGWASPMGALSRPSSGFMAIMPEAPPDTFGAAEAFQTYHQQISPRLFI